MNSNLFWDLNNSIFIYFYAFFEPIIWFILWIFIGVIVAVPGLYAIFLLLSSGFNGIEGGVGVGLLMLVMGIVMIVESNLKKSATEAKFISEIAKVVSPSYYWSILVFLIIFSLIIIFIIGFVRFSDDIGILIGYVTLFLGLAYIIHFVTFDNPTAKLYSSFSRSKCAVQYYVCPSCQSHTIESLLICSVPDIAGNPQNYFAPKSYMILGRSAVFPIQKLHEVYFKQGWYLFQSFPSNIKSTAYALLALIAAILAYALFLFGGRSISDRILLKRIFNPQKTRPTQQKLGKNTQNNNEKKHTNADFQKASEQHKQRIAKETEDFKNKRKKNIDALLQEFVKAEKIRMSAKFAEKSIIHENNMNRTLRETLRDIFKDLNLTPEEEEKAYLSALIKINSKKLPKYDD